jgi:Flp pilus assembly protein TadG
MCHRAVRRRGELASTLLLFPAAVLVVMILSAIAVDMTRLHTAQAELENTVDAAADDAASMIDLGWLRTTGEVRIDPEAARRVAERTVAEEALVGAPGGPVEVRLGPRPGTITVVASRRVHRLFGAALPGVAEWSTVTASAVAELHFAR